MSQNPDPRHITNGWSIPTEGYADQPYVVRTDDGAWLCVMTTGKGTEGDPGQHVVALRSTDHGKTWGTPVAVEPSDGPEASYAVLLKVPSGRVFCFYNHNTDRVPEVKREDGGVYKRVDSLGHFVFKYSDDHGKTWSEKRYDIAVREFECDRKNVYGGKLRFFWNVGRALLTKDAGYVPLIKVGAMGPGFFAQSEGSFLRSRNILTEKDPEKIVFDTLPEGDIGLRTPAGGGRISEEQSLTILSDGSLFSVYRTVDGWPACAYSRDGGAKWSAPQYMTYTPSGRRVKHPRAANFAWRCGNGKFLYWYHNHGGEAAKRAPGGFDPYADRNPAWLTAGVERDSPEGRVIHWAQPEVLLYDDDTFIRMSYPDLVEEEGKFYVTETQKNVARVHPIPPALVQGLFNQWENRALAKEGLLVDLNGGAPLPGEVKMPALPVFHQRDNTRPDYGDKDLRAGFTIDLWVHLASLAPGQVLLDTRTETGQGLALTTTAAGTLELSLSDGRTRSTWDADPGTLRAGEFHHVSVIVDGGPKLILFVVDGVLCDGGKARQFGWGRFSPLLRHANGAPNLKIAPRLEGTVRTLRIYDRPLRVSEAVGNFRAGSGATG